MPPNPAVPSYSATPESLTVEQENCPPHQAPKHRVKQLLTEPRRRQPLQPLDDNRTDNSDPALKNGIHEATKASSAPPIVRCVKIGKGGSKEISESPQVVRNLKRPRTQLANQEGSNSQDWPYTLDRKGVVEVARKLKLGNVPERLRSPLELLSYLEVRGGLSAEALTLYSKCPGVGSLMLSPTYSAKVNELGLLEEGRIPWIDCTKPLYYGYADLAVLDLTCIPITDENLRYLIKLSGLQALGLSGTKVTAKGIKYLGKHALFRQKLQCLKLCCMEKLEDDAIIQLSIFPALNELDLYGSGRLSLGAILDWFPYDFDKRQSPVNKVRIPEKAFGQLREQHVTYASLFQTRSDLLCDPSAIDSLSDHQIRVQLRIHQRHYSHIFLNLDYDSLGKKLKEIVSLRLKEEALWSICS